MTTTPAWKHSLVWIVLAASLGLLVPALFSTWLRWERSLFLVPYVAIAGAFLFLYFWRMRIPLKGLIGNWRYGLIGVAVASFLLIGNIQGQPATTTLNSAVSFSFANPEFPGIMMIS